MRPWLLLLAGLLVWTAHFFGVYIVASLFPGTSLAKRLTILLTFAALGLLVFPAAALLKRVQAENQDDHRRWLAQLALLGCALAALAILYQGLPALFSE